MVTLSPGSLLFVHEEEQRASWLYSNSILCLDYDGSNPQQWRTSPSASTYTLFINAETQEALDWPSSRCSYRIFHHSLLCRLPVFPDLSLSNSSNKRTEIS
jgi:hypothetical protein